MNHRGTETQRVFSLMILFAVILLIGCGGGTAPQAQPIVMPDLDKITIITTPPLPAGNGSTITGTAPMTITFTFAEVSTHQFKSWYLTIGKWPSNEVIFQSEQKNRSDPPETFTIEEPGLYRFWIKGLTWPIDGQAWSRSGSAYIEVN